MARLRAGGATARSRRSFQRRRKRAGSLPAEARRAKAGSGERESVWESPGAKQDSERSEPRDRSAPAKRRARERGGAGGRNKTASGSEPRDRSAPAKRRARERVGGCRGAKQDSERQRATRPERAGEAARERACRGVPGGEAPRTRMRPPRLERGTLGLEGRCSIQLSYGRVEALILAQSPVMNGAAGVVPWGRRDV